MATLGLLKTVQPCEYPAEFLAARLRGKRGGLFRNWENLLSGGSVLERLQGTAYHPYLQEHGSVGLRRFLLHEHLWVYKSMNRKLRNLFEPYFTWHEISTLVVCLRFLAGGRDIVPVASVLQCSLLNDAVQKILTGRDDFVAKLQALEALPDRRSITPYAGLQRAYEKGGMQNLEFFLRSRFWDSVFSHNHPEILKIFFRFLVDFHNVMLLAKNVRWQVATEPQLLPGGLVKRERFRQAYRMRDLAPVLRQLQLQEQDAAAAGPAALENQLLHAIGARLKKYYYQRTETADILFYLWEQYRYCRNISFILNAAFVSGKRLEEGLVI